jgi:hypothetical protein
MYVRVYGYEFAEPKLLVSVLSFTYILEVFQKVFGVGGNYDAVILQRLDSVVEERMTIFVGGQVGVCENGQRIDAIQVLQPRMALLSLHYVPSRTSAKE